MNNDAELTADPALPAYALAVHRFGRTVSRRLLAWSVLSMVGGALLWRRAAPFWRGLGVQALGWGAIDALIAASGLRPGPQPAPEPVRAARNLRRLLWFNAALDVGYMAGGVWLARSKGRADANWRGQGWGIVVQGAFLFVFDVVHAWRVPRGPA
jgi:uncharacterized membrane protein YedE/YeeE